MPKADVATTTSSSSPRNCSCTRSRSAARSPPWYAAARIPRAARASWYRPVSLRVATYTRPGRCCSCTCSTTARRLLLSSTNRCTTSSMLGRSNPWTTSSGSARPSRWTISARTGAAAVAVRATTVRVPQPLDRVTDPQVVGAEVVSPGGDAVRLVHHQQRRGDLRELLEDLLLGELLGGEEQVLRPPGVDLLPRGPHLSGRRRRVHRHGPGYVGRGQCRRLVVLEREQRRDHDRGAVDDQGGDLVDRGLSRARGHHGQHVAAGDERLDRLGLAGPELVPAEAVARQALEVPSSLRRHLQQVPRRTVAIRPAGVVLDRVLP